MCTQGIELPSHASCFLKVLNLLTTTYILPLKLSEEEGDFLCTQTRGDTLNTFMMLLCSRYTYLVPYMAKGVVGIPVLLSHCTQGRLAAQQYRGLMKNY